MTAAGRGVKEGWGLCSSPTRALAVWGCRQGRQTLEQMYPFPSPHPGQTLLLDPCYLLHLTS